MKKLFGFALLASMLFSCSTNDDNSQSDNNNSITDGVYVTNEGNFMSANASVSLINSNLTEIKNNIYKAANEVSVGDVAQSIAFNDDLAFIVVNNSNVIEVVTRNDFKKVHTISQNLVGPRYAVVENDLLYVTNSNNTVAIYNAKSFDFIKTIELSFTPELIVENNDKLYVSSNFDGLNSAVAIINSKTNTLEQVLNFELPINGLTEGNGVVYVLTTSNTKTTIETITDTNISNTKVFSDIIDARFLTYDLAKLYFTSNLGVYNIATTELTKTTEATMLFKVSDNSWSSLYGFEVFDGTIFTSDAKGFTEDSEITIYNNSGTKLNAFTAGIGANGFYKD